MVSRCCAMPTGSRSPMPIRERTRPTPATSPSCRALLGGSGFGHRRRVHAARRCGSVVVRRTVSSASFSNTDPNARTAGIPCSQWLSLQLSSFRSSRFQFWRQFALTEVNLLALLPAPKQSLGDRHVSLLGCRAVPCSVSEIPCFKFLGIRGNALKLFANGRGCIAITSLKRQNFPVFSRETGSTETETGSPMTASTANCCDKLLNCLEILQGLNPVCDPNHEIEKARTKAVYS